MPNFLIEETTVRNSGESMALSLGAGANHHLLLTLCISHVVERQNLDMDILTSRDGVVWSPEPVANFLQKFSCGTFDALVPGFGVRYIKAVWRVSRWGRHNHSSLCRFSLSVQESGRRPEVARAMAGAA